MNKIVMLLIIVLLSGCVKAEEDTTSIYATFLPLVQHDCSWIIRDQEYKNAVVACEERMIELRSTEGRTRLVDDCINPEPQDYCK